VDEWIGIQLFGRVHDPFDLGRVKEHQDLPSCRINEEWGSIAILDSNKG
jgi:hypothetical protein